MCDNHLMFMIFSLLFKPFMIFIFVVLYFFDRNLISSKLTSLLIGLPLTSMIYACLFSSKLIIFVYFLLGLTINFIKIKNVQSSFLRNKILLIRQQELLR